MNIFFDSSPLSSGHKGRGIGVYTKNLKSYLTKLSDISITSSIKDDTQLVHYPYFDFFTNSLPLIKKHKTIVTIHDTIPLVFPDKYRPGIKGFIRLQLQKLSLKSVDAIITDSKASKNDIHKYLEINKKKIFTIPLAVPHDFILANNSSKSSASPENPYILYVGDINYNKNIPALINAFSKIDNKRIDLVIVSRALKNTHIKEAKLIYKAIKDNRISNRIQIYKNASTTKVANLYKQASWYIQPSLYEGFGLPILEAFYSNTPVICAKTSSLPEVAGEGVVYFNPKSVTSITNSINQALSMNKLKISKLKELNKTQLKKFSWDSTAKQTRDVYSQVINQS